MAGIDDIDFGLGLIPPIRPLADRLADGNQHKREAGNMALQSLGNNLSNVDAFLRARLEAQRTEEEVEAKLRIIEQLGDDIFDEGDVLRFMKNFDGTVYKYAAIKANGMWYTTGPRGQRFTWDEFKLWLVSGKYPTAGFEHLVPNFPPFKEADDDPSFLPQSEQESK